MAATSPRKKTEPAKHSGPGSDESFEYETENGLIVIPSIAKMPSGVIRRIRKLSPVDQVFTVVEETASAEALALIDQLPAPEFNAFCAAWYEFSGVSLGESAAS